MTATDTEAALLAAIRENPGDIARRMVYADALADVGRELEAIMQRIIAQPGEDRWRLDYAAELERTAGTVECEACGGKGYWSVHERGEYGPNHYRETCSVCTGTRRVSDGRAKLAEFVRVQVELANWKPYTPPPEIAEIAGGNRLYSMMAREQIINAQARHCGHHDHLRARERELWPAVRGVFEGEGAAKLFPVLGIGGIVGNAPLGLVSRGLPAVVRCTLAEWVGGECENCGGRGELSTGADTFTRCVECESGRTPGIGPKLAPRWPIERVEVMDIEDFGFDSDGLWLAANLPIAITERIPNHGIFPTDDGRSFADWLSDALIAWARGQCV